MSEEDKTQRPQGSDGEGSQEPKGQDSKEASESGEKKVPPTARSSPPSEAKEKSTKPRPSKPAKKGPSYEDLENDLLLQKLQEKFPEGILSGQSFLDQSTYTVSLDVLYDVMVDLKDSPESLFDYLVDLTALDYLGDEKRFCLVYHLYSHKNKTLVRVRSRAAEGELIPSVTSIWKTANWMEREVYDLFGIDFAGHPDLRRILLPDDWHGHPLRKDYDIKLQDQAWIKKHLSIRKTP